METLLRNSRAQERYRGGTRLRRRYWVTGEMITLAEHACFARIQRAPNHQEHKRQTTRAARRHRNAYWKAIVHDACMGTLG